MNAYPWRYSIHLLTDINTYFGVYHSENPTMTSIAVNLHKIADKDDT